MPIAGQRKMPAWKMWLWGVSVILILPAAGYIALSISGWIKPELKIPEDTKWHIIYGTLVISMIISTLKNL